jgi:hypothetical protein
MDWILKILILQDGEADIIANDFLNFDIDDENRSAAEIFIFMRNQFTA